MATLLVYRPQVGIVGYRGDSEAFARPLQRGYIFQEQWIILWLLSVQSYRCHHDAFQQCFSSSGPFHATEPTITRRAVLASVPFVVTYATKRTLCLTLRCHSAHQPTSQPAVLPQTQRAFAAKQAFCRKPNELLRQNKLFAANSTNFCGKTCFCRKPNEPLRQNGLFCSKSNELLRQNSKMER